MVFWQYQNRICCLSHRIRTISDTSHHWAADKIDRIFYCCISSLGNNFLQCTSQRNSHCNRITYLSNNRYIFISYRLLLLNRTIYVINSFYIEYGYSLLNRQSARPYHSSCSFINKYNFIAHGIYLIQKMKSHSRELLNVLVQRIDCLYIRFFNSNDCFRSPYRFLDHMECFHNFICMFFQ